MAIHPSLGLGSGCLLLITLRCGDAARRAQSMRVAHAGWDLLSLKRDPKFLEIEDAIWQLVEEKPERMGMVL